MNVMIGFWQIMVKTSDSLDLSGQPLAHSIPYANWLVDNMIGIDIAHFSKLPANITASMKRQLKDSFLKLLVNCLKYASN